MSLTIMDVIDFLLVGVILKGVLARWFYKLFMWLFKKIALRTGREIVLWNHHWNKAAKPKNKL